MYVNERDQINYHEFLRHARENCGVTQLAVSKGLYTSSSYIRAELGIRVPEKMMRDRLVSRMGLSGERYVEYLGLEELRQWQFRQTIVKALAEKNLTVAETAIAELEKILYKANAVQIQFIKSMRFFLRKEKGISFAELFASVESALSCTVESIDNALMGKHLLSEQELNLIAEFMRLQPFTGNTSDENTWRILEYQKLIAYMNRAFMESLAKVKIYPKVTCLICETLLKEETLLQQLQDAEKLCEESLNLLNETHRLYYFVELLEYRKEILARMLVLELEESEREKIEMRQKEMIALEKLWKERYSQYGISPYMENDVYLYWETDCESAAGVIEARRKMLRIPRLTLCEDICRERSLIRIERTNFTPSMFILQNLFERMGLCAEYRRGQLVSSNVDVLHIYSKLVDAMNHFCEESCNQYLEDLKQIIDMTLSFNQQEIKRIEYIYDYKKNELSEEELEQRIVEALECTFPVWALYHHKRNPENYFTRSELACIYDLAFLTQSSHREHCVEIIEEYCEKQKVYPINLGMMEFLQNGYISYLIENGENEKAEVQRTELIKTCLFHKRMPILFDNMVEKQVMWVE